jgi:hypothetical protein
LKFRFDKNTTGKLVEMLQPHLDNCRRKYARVSYPDAKLGICIEDELKVYEHDGFCASKDGFAFNNQHQVEFLERQNVQHDRPDSVIVAVQEPVPSKIRYLTEFFDAIDRSDKKLTWEVAQANWLSLNFADALSGVLPSFSFLNINSEL